MIASRNANGTIKATHGWSQHPLYNVFKSMHNRCEDPKNQAYERYGGRGITVCEEWSLDNFENYMSWAFANGWQKGLEIDRIDNNKGYSPDNCRIVTPKENSRNRRSNRYVTVNGETLLLSDAIDKYCVVTKKQFEWRIYCGGWSLERALFEPITRKHKNDKKGLS